MKRRPSKQNHRKKRNTSSSNRSNPRNQRLDPNKKEASSEDYDELALNKYIALSGVCSRRKAVELIEKGEISINGKVADKPFTRVTPQDKVTYKGKLIRPEVKKQYILLNKPKNCITSLHDPEGRLTVIDVVKGACSERIFPVGRLDRNTTGLLLLTNDGDLAKKLSHPSHSISKLYYATLDKPVLPEHIDQILNGLQLEDGPVPVDACGFVEGTDNMQVGIEIHIGRNRIVRRTFEHFGYQVKKLDRLLYAGLTKKGLPKGRWRHLTEAEVRKLKHFT